MGDGRAGGCGAAGSLLIIAGDDRGVGNTLAETPAAQFRSLEPLHSTHTTLPMCSLVVKLPFRRPTLSISPVYNSEHHGLLLGRHAGGRLTLPRAQRVLAACRALLLHRLHLLLRPGEPSAASLP